MWTVQLLLLGIRQGCYENPNQDPARGITVNSISVHVLGGISISELSGHLMSVLLLLEPR